MIRTQQVGFSQRIRLDWLEYTANLLLAGCPTSEIVAALKEHLRDRLSVGNDPKRGNRDKAITILTRVWVTVPADLRQLRDKALELLQRLPASDRILVHWCMCMAVYPFFGTVADATGRLLRLQGTTAAAQVQRRVREQLGERETVARAARRVLRAFIDWGVLLETHEKGIYRGAAKHAVHDLALRVWTIEAILFAKDRTPQPVPDLVQGPHLFPFDIVPPPVRRLETCGEFEVTRYGLNNDLLLGLARTSPDRETRPLVRSGTLRD